MKILVSGGSGYIGSCFVELALVNGHEVVIASRTQPKTASGWIYYSLGEPDQITVPADVDMVVHMAAVTEYTDSSRLDEVGAAIALKKAASRAHARFCFVSSQSASPDAPTEYGRIKWDIERAVSGDGVFIVRLGQVYGGKEDALFGSLVDLVRRLPVLPDFRPHVYIQPIHVEDCARGLLTLIEKQDAQDRTYCLASPEPISFTEFLYHIAKNRVRGTRLFVPVPVFLIKYIIAVSKKLGIRDAGIYRLNSLFGIKFMASEEDTAYLRLNLRPLDKGMHIGGRPWRRDLVSEGRAFLCYMLKQEPGKGLIKRYVYAIEGLRDGAPIGLKSLALSCPVVLALYDDASVDHIVGKEFFWRLHAAALIAESSPQGACRFLSVKKRPAWYSVFYVIFNALSIEFVLRVLRLLKLPYIVKPLVMRSHK